MLFMNKICMKYFHQQNGFYCFSCDFSFLIENLLPKYAGIALHKCGLVNDDYIACVWNGP